LDAYSQKFYTARTHTLQRCMYVYTRRVIGDDIFTLRGCGFVLARRFPLRECCMVYVDLFCSSDLMTLTDDLHTRTWPELPGGYAFESYRLTDIQTYRHRAIHTYRQTVDKQTDRQNRPKW